MQDGLDRQQKDEAKCSEQYCQLISAVQNSAKKFGNADNRTRAVA